jgi:hypothetical protein
MEIETRFYFPDSSFDDIKLKLNQFADLDYDDTYYEKTLLYDNPNPEFSFYSQLVDGRFRVRLAKSISRDSGYCLISWKRRLEKNVDGIHKEEEIEIKIDFNQFDNTIILIENVIKMRRMGSYERYRQVFRDTNVEIALDKFPFGVALEIEQKSNASLDQNRSILSWVEKLGLSLNDSYKLSWDDKYLELCIKNNVSPKTDVLFSDESMPSI